MSDPTPITLGMNREDALALLAGCLARRRELDKAFKACMKAEAVPAAEKVSEKIKTIASVEIRIKDAMSEE